MVYLVNALQETLTIAQMILSTLVQDYRYVMNEKPFRHVAIIT